MYNGIGAGLGALLAGGLWTRLGGARIFALGAVVLAGAWLAGLGAVWAWRRWTTRPAAATAYSRLDTELVAGPQIAPARPAGTQLCA